MSIEILFFDKNCFHTNMNFKTNKDLTLLYLLCRMQILFTDAFDQKKSLIKQISTRPKTLKRCYRVREILHLLITLLVRIDSTIPVSWLWRSRGAGCTPPLF